MEEKKNCPETAEKAETTETKEELVPEDESKLSEEDLEDVSGGKRKKYRYTGLDLLGC